MSTKSSDIGAVKQIKRAPSEQRKRDEINRKKAVRYGAILDVLELSDTVLKDKELDEVKAIVQSRLEEIKVERTSEDILFSKGVKVTLCGKEYELKPLPMKKDLEWRKKLAAMTTRYMKFFTNDAGQGVTTDNWMETIIPIVFTDGMDDAVDLLFEYSDELKEDRDQILENANRVEITNAAMEGMKIAYPFIKTLVTTMMGSIKGQNKTKTLEQALRPQSSS